MNGRNGLDVTVRLGRLNVNDEDAVGSCGFVVLGSLAHDSVSVANEKEVQSILLVLAVKGLKVI